MKINLIKIHLFTLFILFFSSNLIAIEKDVVCIKYQTQSGWSQAYEVEGTILKGFDLNRLTMSNAYKPLVTYVVVFWENNQATIIESDSLMITLMESNGVDQNGVTWKVKKGGISY